MNVSNIGNEKEDIIKDGCDEKIESNVCESSGGTTCDCSGQKLEHGTWEDEGKNYRCSEEIIDSWTWGEQPRISELSEAVHSLMVEQLELVNEALKSTPSSIRLHQRLLVLERYYIAYVSSSNALLGFKFAAEDDMKSFVKKEKNFM